ncbi:MAG: hypothetical protein AB7G28_06015 [Pirellulales bacterium]
MSLDLTIPLAGLIAIEELQGAISGDIRALLGLAIVPLVKFAEFEDGQKIATNSAKLLPGHVYTVELSDTKASILVTIVYPRNTWETGGKDILEACVSVYGARGESESMVLACAAATAIARLGGANVRDESLTWVPVEEISPADMICRLSIKGDVERLKEASNQFVVGLNKPG